MIFYTFFLRSGLVLNMLPTQLLIGPLNMHSKMMRRKKTCSHIYLPLYLEILVIKVSHLIRWIMMIATKISWGLHSLLSIRDCIVIIPSLYCLGSLRIEMTRMGKKKIVLTALTQSRDLDDQSNGLI